MWMEVLGVLLGLLGVLWLYVQWCFRYWSSRGVEGPAPTFLVGNSGQTTSGEPWNFVLENYKKYFKNKVFGTYETLNPAIFVCDPDIIKHVLVKDFDYFVDRRTITIFGDEGVMSENLFILEGEKWRKLRSILSPSFSSGKIKSMYKSIHKHSDIFNKECLKHTSKLDAKDMFGRYAIEVISSCAFGIETNSILNKNNKFLESADELFRASFIKVVKCLIINYMPLLAKLFGLSFEDKTTLFFKDVTSEAIKQRRENDIFRGDFLDLLIEDEKKQQNQESVDYKITDTTIIASSILFLLAGYDTTTNALTHATHYLAKHTEIQEKVREEVQSLLDADGQLDYYKLMEAKYIDACISETLRLNPPIAFLERTCMENYQLPGTDIIVPKKMMTLIPVWGLHRDEQFWENPDKYEPARFLPENKSKIVPFTYMPFGLGPRNCIAMRFALMEIKVCLARFLLDFKFTLAPGHEELKLVAGDGVVRPADDSVILVLEKIE